MSLALATNVLAAQYPPGPHGCCPDTLTIINVQNPLATPHPTTGDVVLGVGGVVTGFADQFRPFGFYMQMRNGLRYSGVGVFTGNVNHGPGTPHNLQLGDSVVVYGKVKSYKGAVAIGSLGGGDDVAALPTTSPLDAEDLLVRVVSHGNPLPPFHVGSLAELEESRLNPAARPWDGMLVRLNAPLVVVRLLEESDIDGDAPTDNDHHHDRGFLVVDPGCPGPVCDTVMVDCSTLTTLTPPPVGTRLAFVQGCFDLREQRHRIQMRGPYDIGVGDPSVPIFSPPFNVSKSATASRDPDVVLGANGGLFMTWGRVFNESVHSLSLDNTSNWSNAAPIMHQGVQPALAVTPSNKFCVLAASPESLLFTQSTDGGFQMDPRVTTVDASPTRYPAFTVGSGEHLHAAWERPGSGIFYARSFTGGADFSTPIPLAPESLSYETNSMARICASNGEGENVYVFWQYHLPGEPGVDKVMYSRSLNGGTSFSAPRQVRDESNPLTSVVKLAVLGDAQVGLDGTVYVMGLQEGGSNDSLAFLRSTNGGFTFALVGHPSAPALTGICPKSFAVGPDGTIHALVGICGTALFYTRSTDGGASWGPAVDVTSSQSSVVGEPRGAKIVLDVTGTPFIVWFAPAGGSTEIYSARLLN